MPATLVRNLAADLRPARRPARLLYAGAAAWLASGLVHLVVLAANGWAWSGAVSFRKPLTFSVSIALLLATIGWVLDRLPDRPRLAGTIAWTLLVSSTVEVGLITMQAWRGRASHFNTLADRRRGRLRRHGGHGRGHVAVPGHRARLVAGPAPRDPLARLAVIGGLVLVVIGLGFGQWIVELGNDFVGDPPGRARHRRLRPARRGQVPARGRPPRHPALHPGRRPGPAAATWPRRRGGGPCAWSSGRTRPCWCSPPPRRSPATPPSTRRSGAPGWPPP